jgi:hypothetical protein
VLEHERVENRKKELKCLNPLMLDIRWRCLTVNSGGSNYFAPCQLVPNILTLSPTHISENYKVILALGQVCNFVMVVKRGIGEVRVSHLDEYNYTIVGNVPEDGHVEAETSRRHIVK